MINILILFMIVLIVLSSYFFIVSKAKKNREKGDEKDREYIIRSANKRLASNPKDFEALESLADLYYSEGAYKKAMHAYRVLLDQPTTKVSNVSLDFRYGLCAMKCELWNEAYKSFMVSRATHPNNSEVNFYLGKIEFMRKNYEKVLTILNSVMQIEPNNAEVLKYLGKSYYHLKRPIEAIPVLNRAIVANPDDNESLYALALCEYDVLRLDIAQNLFRKLLFDPQLGSKSALYSGKIFAKKLEWEAAISDYQIGLGHEHIDEDIKLEIQYNLAEAFVKTLNITAALDLLEGIYEIVPGYKNVASLITRQRELHSNKNLQIYLFAPTVDFIELCWEIIRKIFPDTEIKASEVHTQKSEYVDLFAVVKAGKREDITIFRFIRTEGQIGELFMREFHSQLKESHASRGFCLTIGDFSLEAIRFVEARIINLVNKAELMKIFRTIDMENLVNQKDVHA